MEHAGDFVQPLFSAHSQAAMFLKPGKQPFDFPLAAVMASGLCQKLAGELDIRACRACGNAPTLREVG